MQNRLMNWTLKEEARLKRSDSVLDPVIAELVGARLMHAIDIGAPRLEIISQAQAEERSEGDWIFKFMTAEGLVLSVERIKGAISLHYLRVLHGIECEPTRWDLAEYDKDDLIQSVCKFTTKGMLRLLDKGKGGLENPSAFYADFTVPEDTSRIRESIAWDSTQRLEIHTARLLLGTTCAHAGNILVDGRGRLYSIDHESVRFSSGEDIEILAESIKRPSRALSIIRTVANRLDSCDIESLFDNLPNLPWPLGTKTATLSYFRNRLRRFQLAMG